MLTSAKFELPDTLLSGALAYACEHNTTLTALLITQLETITKVEISDPLVQFSRNLLTKEQAVQAAGLRDYAQLLVSMGDADLPLPSQPPAEISHQAAIFAELLAS